MLYMDFFSPNRIIAPGAFLLLRASGVKILKMIAIMQPYFLCVRL